MFDCYVRAVTENGKLIFPEDFCFSHEPGDDTTQRKALDEIQQQLGPYLYAGNYYNNPTSEDLVEFKKEWFRSFDYNMETVQRLYNAKCIISIDPATKTKENNDPTGIIVAKIDLDGYVYILEAYDKKMRPNDLVEEIFRLNDIYRPTKVMIESVSAQEIWLPLFALEMRTRKKRFILEGYDQGTSQSKTMKIRKLIPFYARGQVLHKKGLQTLEQQLNEFPRNRKDDVIDALQAQIPYWTGTATSTQQKMVKYSKAWWDMLRAQNTSQTITAEQKLFEDVRHHSKPIIRQPHW